MDQLTLSLRITGLIALLGALLFAIGDVLLLASKASLADYPRLKPFAKLLSDAEKMVVLSPNRMIWGALLGVFAAPLVLAGYWQIYQGLSGANTSIVLTTVLLFAVASVVGAFVHGTFYYMGEYIQALNKVEDGSQSVIADMIVRHRKVLIISYAPVLILILIASILFSILVASGETAFPVWMAAVNPVTMTIVWLILKRILPQSVRDWTEGAGFNIAYLA
ncbi:MAG TPA: DUF6796 family protein, partial [Anaerolineales bacterium]